MSSVWSGFRRGGRRQVWCAQTLVANSRVRILGGWTAQTTLVAETETHMCYDVTLLSHIVCVGASFHVCDKNPNLAWTCPLWSWRTCLLTNFGQIHVLTDPVRPFRGCRPKDKYTFEWILKNSEDRLYKRVGQTFSSTWEREEQDFTTFNMPCFGHHRLPLWICL